MSNNFREDFSPIGAAIHPGGVFVVSYLPNWLSHDEFLRRRTPNTPHHLRRYGLAETRRLLLRTGFNPLQVAYQHWGWERRAEQLFSDQRLVRRLASFLRVVLLVPIRCSTLFAVGRKVVCM